MKALTVYQPWASLIAAGLKPYEFRKSGLDKHPLRTVIGERIAIQAGARPVRAGEYLGLIYRLRGLHNHPPPALAEGAEAYLSMRPKSSFPRSCIVCTVIVGNPVRGDEAARRMGIPLAGNDSDREETFNWGWPMLYIKTVSNIPCRGAQGVWTVPAPIVAEFKR